MLTSFQIFWHRYVSFFLSLPMIAMGLRCTRCARGRSAIIKKNNLNLRTKDKCKGLFSLDGKSLKRLVLKFIKHFFANKKKGPSSCLLLRRFVFSRSGKHKTRVTGDEAQGTIGRKKLVRQTSGYEAEFFHNVMQTDLFCWRFSISMSCCSSKFLQVMLQ